MATRTASQCVPIFRKPESASMGRRFFPAENDTDPWALATLRLVQFPEIGSKMTYEQLDPGLHRDGFERVKISG